MKIGIIGATGAVGKVFLNLLPNSTLEISDLKLTASKRSIGKKINYENKEYTIQEHNDDFYNDLDYVFSSASSEVSKIAAQKSKEHNVIMIDDSSEFRLDKDVPLVVPEINSQELNNHKGIVAIPNCTTTPLAMILDAVRSNYRIKRVIVEFVLQKKVISQRFWPGLMHAFVFWGFMFFSIITLDHFSIGFNFHPLSDNFKFFYGILFGVPWAIILQFERIRALSTIERSSLAWCSQIIVHISGFSFCKFTIISFNI